MKRHKQLIGLLCAASLALSVPFHAYALEDGGGFGAGEMDQDNSGVLEVGDPNDFHEDKPEPEKPKQPSVPVQQRVVDNSYIRQKNEEISEAQKERESLESELSDVKKIKDELEKTKDDLNEYVVKLDANLDDIEVRLDDINILIEEKQQAINETKAELDEALRIEEAQYESMKKRMRLIYEKGNNSLIEIFFGEGSFAQKLNKAEYVQKVSDYDRRKMQEYQETIAYIRLCQDDLDVQKETLLDAQEAARNEQNAIQNLILQKQQKIEEYSSDISTREEQIEEYEAYITEQNNTIASLERAVAAEKKRLAQSGYASNLSYNGGTFTWPAPEYTRISDDYGNRIHPILKVEKFHNGVDMAAPNGSPILAAYDGQVVAAEYNASMGNYVMIDHGDGLYTIYMHASMLNVSEGQMVSAGDQIAAVGSTGRSTGPHLHFSVRLNGNYVNPWNYL